MPRFQPFPGLRYHPAIDLDEVIAPPYDVIDDEERAVLAGRSPYNAVRVELPYAEGGGDPYQLADRLLEEWQREGVLAADGEASFYLYRMGYHDQGGRPRQTSGVIGAMELSVPGEGDVLPHEQTTPRARSDRLRLLETTRCNLSPIWCLSLAKGLAALSEPSGPPLARATDDDGNHHRLWRVEAPAVVVAISQLVASAPAVIADGHHRYETALAYRGECRRQNGDSAGPHDLTMTLMVELTESELSVQAIHRLLRGLPPGLDVIDALSAWFDGDSLPTTGAALLDGMEGAGALGLVLPDGTGGLLRPRPGAFPDDLPDLDASRLDVARAVLPAHEIVYQHDPEAISRQVRADDGTSVGVLLRPATVAQIAATADRRDRMPPKTTYFWPKPRTGMVFRSVDRGTPSL